MYLQEISLTNFKNHPHARYGFGPHINCIIGKNGTGKTNLLDSIYYLAFTKSALNASDKLSIAHDMPAFALFGRFDALTVGVQVAADQPKVIKADKQEVEKISDFIGSIPLVIILPDDTELIKEGSELRRKFVDGALSQLDRGYLLDLLSYNRVLKQRNSLLKQAKGRINPALLEAYDEKLIPLAIKISTARRSLIKAFEPYLEKNYKDLHQGHEVPALHFKSHVDEHFAEKLRGSLPKDLIMERTLVGSHKDDITFQLDDAPIKKFGSQGQQKTFIISLKLAMYDLLKAKKAVDPLLLLDDIFDKLDDERIHLLIRLLHDTGRFGQVFITDARKDRSKALLQGGGEVTFIQLD